MKRKEGGGERGGGDRGRGGGREIILHFFFGKSLYKSLYKERVMKRVVLK